MARQTPTPCLITVDEAALLLSVSPRTVLAWIRDEALPYVELRHPDPRKGYQLPLHGLVRSLPELFDLATEFRDADDVVTDAQAPKEAAEPHERIELLTSVAKTTLHAVEEAPPVKAFKERAAALQDYYVHS